MNSQPQRLLGRKSSSGRQINSDDDGDSSDDDGWISSKPKQKSASLSFALVRDSDNHSNKKQRATVSSVKKTTFATSDRSSSSDDDSSSASSKDGRVNLISRSNSRKETNANNNNISNGQKSKESNLRSKILSKTATKMHRDTFTKVAKRVSKAGVRASTTPENAPSSTASSRANKASIPEGITSPSQLQWYRIVLGQGKEGTRERLQPCRKLSRGEAFAYKRKYGGDSNTTGKTIIEYLTLSNDNHKKHCVSVDDNLLIPFGYRSRDGISFSFNDDYLQRFMNEQRRINSPSELETLKLYLQRVFSYAIRMEKESKDQANKDLEDYYEDCAIGKGDSRVTFDVDEESNDNDESDDEDEFDAPYTQAITYDPDKFEPMAENETSNEPIRVGDVVEYYSPIHVAGDPRGLRQATVLSIDPKNEFPLVLDNAECIPNDTNVKRIKVKMDGELVDHPGIFRPIIRFKLSKAGKATIADAVAKQSSRFGNIMKKNIKKLKSKAEADGFAPMDLLVNVKGANTSSQSSSEVSAPKASQKKGVCQSLLSSSSESSDDDSSEDEYPTQGKSKASSSATRKVELEIDRATTPKLKENKENSYTASHRDRGLSLGSLSSKASLGTSLASSSDDDNSIESVPQVNLGTNHSSMTQQCQQQQKKNDVGMKKTKKSKAALDLHSSSDDIVNGFTPKSAKSGSSSESSSDVSKPQKLKRKMSGSSYNFSVGHGSSKKRSESRKQTPDSQTSSASKKRAPKPNSQESSESSEPALTPMQRKHSEEEATSDLGWTRTKGGWEKTNENASFSFAIGRFK